MYKKLLTLLIIIFPFVLASCNVSRNSQTAMHKAEMYSDRWMLPYDNIYSPLKGQTVLAMAIPDYEEKGIRANIYAATNQGVYLLDKSENPKGVWEHRPLPLPSGYENSQIIAAASLAGDRTLLLAVNKNRSGLLRVLRLMGRHKGDPSPRLVEVEGIPASTRVYADKFITPDIQNGMQKRGYLFLVGANTQGDPEIYQFKSHESLASRRELTNTGGFHSNLRNGDQVIDFIANAYSWLSTDERRGEGAFLVRTKSPQPYQIWRQGKELVPLQDPALQQSRILLPSSNVKTSKDPHNNHMLLATDNGSIWLVNTLTGGANLLRPAFAQSLNPTAWEAFRGQRVLGTESGYFELPPPRATGKILGPTTDTTDVKSYQEKGIGSYKIMNIYVYPLSSGRGMSYVFLATSHGLWQKDPLTHKWTGI